MHAFPTGAVLHDSIVVVRRGGASCVVRERVGSHTARHVQAGVASADECPSLSRDSVTAGHYKVTH